MCRCAVSRASRLRLQKYVSLLFYRFHIGLWAQCSLLIVDCVSCVGYIQFIRKYWKPFRFMRLYFHSHSVRMSTKWRAMIRIHSFAIWLKRFYGNSNVLATTCMARNIFVFTPKAENGRVVNMVMGHENIGHRAIFTDGVWWLCMLKVDRPNRHT